MKAKKSVRKKAKIKKVSKKKPSKKPKGERSKPWSDATFQGLGIPPLGWWGPD